MGGRSGGRRVMGRHRTPVGSGTGAAIDAGVAVTLEGLFSTCNLIALAGWILLLALPRSRRAMSIAGTLIPLSLAAIYLALFVLHARGSQGGFSSLAAVAPLFENHWLLL